ncbi:MAG: phosphate/phosphite/phosphonate ABC transporter substrate-binding protein, partial [Verrucomicrobiota bacterium]
MKILRYLIAASLALFAAGQIAIAAPAGTKDDPLRVMLIPADGGTEEGTIADFKPVFNAVTQAKDIHFDIKVGQSYGAVVEAMANGLADIAWFGPVSYLQAKERGGAQLLAISESKGDAVYYSGIFVPVDSPAKSLADLKGKRMAFGDPSSTSSFNFPVAMLLAAGVDPSKDLSEVYITGSHSNSIAALVDGKVDACACSFPSFGKAVEAGVVNPEKFKPLLKSDPIPNPPLAMHPKLPDATKKMLKEAFHTLHENPAIKPEQIRGYGGKVYERYNAEIGEEVMDAAGAKLSKVTDEIKGAMLKRAAE